jgi:hypothetical protein
VFPIIIFIRYNKYTNAVTSGTPVGVAVTFGGVELVVV